MKGRSIVCFEIKPLLWIILYVYISGTIVIYDDNEANEKYLTLDQLGVVLKHLSEQLPGISIHQALK